MKPLKAYLLFNSDIVNFVWKTDEGEAESIVFLIFVLWWCFNRRWVRGCGVGQKVLFRASGNRIFFQRGFSPSNKHDTFWHFYEPLLFQIFFPLKFIKLRPSLSSINFAINNHADNLFSIYISFFQILYNMKSIFLFKYTLRFFIFKFDLNVKQSPYFFPVKVMVCRKNSIENKSFFSVDYVKIIELQVVTSHAI